MKKKRKKTLQGRWRFQKGKVVLTTFHWKKEGEKVANKRRTKYMSGDILLGSPGCIRMKDNKQEMHKPKMKKPRLF